MEFNRRMGRWICGCGWKSDKSTPRRPPAWIPNTDRSEDEGVVSNELVACQRRGKKKSQDYAVLLLLGRGAL
jgi:hypothetical protein